MEAPKITQTATYYDYGVSKLESIQKPKYMNKQLSIEDKVMLNGHSSIYDFTKLNHFEIVDMFEKCRIKYNLTEKEFSELARYSRCCYMQKMKNQHRFSYTSFNRFKNVCDNLERNSKQKPIYAPNETTSNINVEFVGKLTEEMCINFLKSTGKYKISKSEITTNWIEL